MSDLKEFKAKISSLSPQKLALLAVQQQAKLLAREAARFEPIAIVGVGCRFPAGAASAEALWRNLLAGVDGVVTVPESRWKLDEYFDEDPSVPGKTYSRHGGFLDQVDQFEPEFFRISPREASAMDPQQRLLLEVAWEAFENAGVVPSGLSESSTGVFVGVMNPDYGELQIQAGAGDYSNVDSYSGTGKLFSSVAGRLSFVFGLHGPSIAVDAACASSLVTVHLACQSLRSGESDLALAGGVNVMVSPYYAVCGSKLHALSPDGRCKTFDARANGYVRGEGCGLVVLKRLSDAIAGGDRIVAVIRGSATNHNGPSSGFTVPNAAAQQAVMRRALENAGVEPGDVGYVEAHGTGTSLGDPIELRSLSAVYCGGRPPERPLMVGSVKTNLGHLESAAGVLGLIKTALCVSNGEIPKHLHLKVPTPNLDWDALKISIPPGGTPWTEGAGKKRLAGVSSFGLSGMNAHVILEEPPTPTEVPLGEMEDACILPLSARTDSALSTLVEQYRSYLTDTNAGLGDILWTAAAAREHHPKRVAIVGRGRQGLVQELEKLGRAELPLVDGKLGQTVFVYSGQGSQWPGMGKALLNSNEKFRRAVEECGVAIARHCPDWSVMEEIANGCPSLDRIDVVQPLLFAMAVGITALWRSRGVRPDFVIGHSMGEVAAAYIAGMLSLEDAAKVICVRSRLLRGVSGRGGMALVQLNAGDAEQEISGQQELVSVAISNSPKSTVLSGDVGALTGVVERLSARGVFCRWIKVDVASHSPQMDAIKDELEQTLGEVRGRAGEVKMYSTVTGRLVDGGELGAKYWVDNLRKPVRFSAAVEAAAGVGCSVFVEASPHPILMNAVEESLEASGQRGVAVGSLHRERRDDEESLRALGALYAAGRAIDWPLMFAKRGRMVALPSYPWQRTRHWVSDLGRRRGSRGVHPLLGEWLPLANGKQHIFTNTWDLEQLSFLRGHQVLGLVVCPAAAFVEMVLAAGRIGGSESVELSTLEVLEPLILSERGSRKVQVSLLNEEAGSRIEISSAEVTGNESVKGWTLHATAWVRPRGEPREWVTDLARFDATGRDVVPREEVYRNFSTRGLDYTGMFQGIVDIGRDGNCAFARVVLADGAGSGYGTHPALLDSCFQLVARLALEHAAADDVILPIQIEMASFDLSPSREVWCVARLREGGAPELVKADLIVLDANKRLIGSVEGLTGKRVAADTLQRSLKKSADDSTFELQWKTVPLRPHEERGRKTNAWLVLADAGGVGDRLAEAIASRGELAIQLRPAEEMDEVQSRIASVLAAESERDLQVVCLWSLDAPGNGSLANGELESWHARTLQRALALVQGLSQQQCAEPRIKLRFVTQGAQSVLPGEGVALAQAPMIGLGRVVRREKPEFNCTLIDLPTSIAADALASELLLVLDSNLGESELALRGTEWHSPRLVASTTERSFARRVAQVKEGRSFEVKASADGILGNLQVLPISRRAPEADEVEIEVRAAGVNFRDVLNGMNLVDQDRGKALGGEYAGVITKVGGASGTWRVGDEVMGIALGSFASHVCVKAANLISKPTGMSFENAAALPAVFLTCLVGLEGLTHLRAGERILVHAAAGGVGLAAIQLAQRVGAEVWATAGSEDKRALLRKLGVKHVFHSRTLDFAHEIMELTEGRGVDVVLNSLNKEFIPKSFGVLAKGGRFVEIGKIGSWTAEQVAALRPDVEYHHFDVATELDRDPALRDRLLKALSERLQKREYQELPIREFSFEALPTALHYMMGAKHTGKIVLRMSGESGGRAPWRADATYLITGGLGGVGLELAKFVVRHGARRLVLTGRRTPSSEAQRKIDELRAQGVDVRVVAADVALLSDVERVVAECNDTGFPLKGIIHGAGVLEDGMIEKQTWESFHRVLAPKVSGAWNLHHVTLGMDLEHFILLSSLSSVIGNPGQSNYAAANSFLDALAWERASNGLVAQSQNWGAWAAVGLAAQRHEAHGDRWRRMGVGQMPPEDAVEIFGKVVGEGTQRTLAWVDWKVMREQVPQGDEPSMMKVLLGNSVDVGREQQGLLATLQSAPERKRVGILRDFVRTQVRQVLGLSGGISLDDEKGFFDMGLDSLTAVELRNRVQLGVGTRVSSTLVFDHPSVGAVTSYLMKLLKLTNEQGVETKPAVQEKQDRALDLLLEIEGEGATEGK